MKLKIKSTLLALLSVVLSINLTSCVNDLDVTPIDPSVTQTFNQNSVFAKVYSSLALTGQEGPAGTPDINTSVIDEGTSSFIRLIWNLNELSSDEALCCWLTDPGVVDLNGNKWTSSNAQVKGMYARLYFGVTICNHFLEQTTGITDAETVKQRAEVRFIRALNYFYLLDMFGNVPFTEVVATEAPTQIKRADLYSWIEKELSECEADMYDARQAPYYRVDKVANWLLRSRLYLNAEVYTGTAQWNNAAIYAKKVLDSEYSLCKPYKLLFMADNAGTVDNSTNTAPNEIILPIACDGIKTKSWGNSLFLVASTHNSDMPNWGSEGWGGNRARAALSSKFFPSGKIPSNADLTDLTTAAGDDRAMLFAFDRTFEIASNKETDFKLGLSVMKYSNVRSDGGATNDVLHTDTDVPLLRKAEAYLTYGEAVFRGGAQVNGLTALAAVNALRERANAALLQNLNLNNLLDEWSREFYFEGRRRMDLIRFGKFGGSDYNWEWKGGSRSGVQFSSDYNLFPIPSTDLNANPNLKQNPGY